ncbi:hypothetical protein WA026_020516 [Henosepilachna vigintioctopunctata]
MTKLFEWLSALAILATIWISLLTNKVENSFSKEHPKLLLYTPLISLASFGLYAVFAVLYQTLNFNNCEEAAEELLKDINEAKTSLAFEGYKFPERP